MVETTIIPSSPFSFTGTVQKPSHFPTPDNYHEPGIYWQSMYFQDNTYGIKMRDIGKTNDPGIQLTVFYDASQASPPLEAIKQELVYRFNLDGNLTEFNNRFISDPYLKPALDRWKGMRVSTPYSLYEFTVVTTVLQNTVVSRTVQMMLNLFRTFGTQLIFDEKELFAFWSPVTIEHVDESDLRDLKVGYRAKTLKRQASEFASGRLNESLLRQMDKNSLREELLKLYGIGPATVEYMLFEVFHHHEGLKHIPPWEQKIYSRLLFDKESVETSLILEELKKRYGDWQKLAIHYIFEDLFWLRKNENIPWLEELIRL